jgi:hypothetical protein
MALTQFEGLLMFHFRAGNIDTLNCELDCRGGSVMQCHGRGGRKFASGLLSVLFLGILAGTAVAKKQPKTYLEEGTIIGTGTTEHTHVGGSIFGAPGAATMGSVGSRSKYTHTYRVQTGTKILELDCGQEAVFHSTGSECGGKNPLKVGDVIHFRIEKEWVYIPIIAKVPVDELDPSQGSREEQIEEQLRILSEDEAPKGNDPGLAPQQAAAANVAKLSIASTPAGADIEVDGSFVGNTPSTIEVTPGDHTVSVSKSGYKSWERKLKASGGNVNLNAELEAQAK